MGNLNRGLSLFGNTKDLFDLSDQPGTLIPHMKGAHARLQARLFQKILDARPGDPP